MEERLQPRIHCDLMDSSRLKSLLQQNNINPLRPLRLCESKYLGLFLYRGSDCAGAKSWPVFDTGWQIDQVTASINRGRKKALQCRAFYAFLV
jgi:hypothetical protein